MHIPYFMYFISIVYCRYVMHWKTYKRQKWAKRTLKKLKKKRRQYFFRLASIRIPYSRTGQHDTFLSVPLLWYLQAACMSMAAHGYSINTKLKCRGEENKRKILKFCLINVRVFFQKKELKIAKRLRIHVSGCSASAIMPSYKRKPP